MISTESPRILFVDDEATAVKYFQRAIGTLAPVVAASSVDEGIALLEQHAASLAVLVSDQRMPGRFGNELLRHARERYPHMVRILTTAYSEIEYTVDAINDGQIHRYIRKPWEISALRMELRQALELADLRIERDALVRDKMQVRQQELLAHRIGMFALSCQQLPAAVRDAYFGMALAAGARAPAPDWQQMDHADLVELETQRSLLFMTALSAVLEPVRAGQCGTADEAWALVQAALPGKLERAGAALRFCDPALPAAFLAGPPGQPVGQDHVDWLAALAQLHAQGWTLRAGCMVRLQAHPPPEPAPLAAWIEQFQRAQSQDR